MDLARLQKILDHFPSEKIAVIGDYFLDRYLLIDPALHEPSLETGLTAYQIVGKRRSPGAAGTVVNNLRALGVGTIYAVGMTGVDGEGLELRMELTKLGVELEHLYAVEERYTPAYIKPMLLEKDAAGRIVERELNREDIKNRAPLPPWVEFQIEKTLDTVAGEVDAIMVMDQVTQQNCGVITDRVREKIAELGRKNKPKIIYADSREQIARFSEVLIKCNHFEVVAPFYPEYDRISGTAKTEEPSEAIIEECGRKMMERTGRTVFVTLGSRGQWVFSPEGVAKVPAVLVEGPIDICGAGDATSSGIVAALCAGAGFAEAALVGNLVASITIRQLGTTGTASPRQVLEAFRK